MTRRLKVPFGTGEVGVYLRPGEGSETSVLVNLDSVLKAIVPRDEYLLPRWYPDLPDRSREVGASDTVVTWRSLSKLALAIMPTDGKRRVGKNKATLDLLFFAQCVMRGFLHRITKLEAEVVEGAQRQLVHWKTPVAQMRKEERSYVNVLGDTSRYVLFLKDEIAYMWRRVLSKVDARNSQALRKVLRNTQGLLLEMKEHEEVV